MNIQSINSAQTSFGRLNLLRPQKPAKELLQINVPADLPGKMCEEIRNALNLGEIYAEKYNYPIKLHINKNYESFINIGPFSAYISPCEVIKPGSFPNKIQNLCKKIENLKEGMQTPYVLDMNRENTYPISRLR